MIEPVMNAARIFRNFLSIGALSLLALTANAALFGDDEARRAILDLRQKVDAQQQRNIEELKKVSEEFKKVSEELKKFSEESKKASEESKKASDESKKASDEFKKASDENAQLRRGILDLSNQIEVLRADIAKLRGQDEQLAREVRPFRRRTRLYWHRRDWLTTETVELPLVDDQGRTAMILRGATFSALTRDFPEEMEFEPLAPPEA